MTNDLPDRLLHLSYGVNRSTQTWGKLELTTSSLVDRFFGAVPVGPKDGSCIISGALVGTNRSKNSVRSCDILMCDHDTGETMDEVEDAIRAKGLGAVLWHTHSHLKARSEVKESEMLRWARRIRHTGPVTPDLVARYLHEEKGLVAAVCDSITDTRLEHTEGGAAWVVEHAPLHRLRSLFVLAEPFVFVLPDGSRTHADRMTEWSERYAAFAGGLGVGWDRSCTDPSRLMYLPRRPANSDPADWEIRVVPGAGLVLPEVAAAIDIRTAFDDLQHAPTNSRGPTEFATPRLGAFLARYGKYFLAAQWLERHAGQPRRIEGDKVTFECPLDQMHSDAGNPHDVAFMAIDAEPETGRGWHMGCLHQTCIAHTDKDRARYLDAACQKYEIADAFELLEFCPGAPEGETVLAQVDRIQAATRDVRPLAERIAALSDTATPAEIEDVLTAIAAARPNSFEEDRLLREVCDQTNFGIRLIRNAYKPIRRALPPAIGADGEPILPPGEGPPLPGVPRDPERAETIWDHWDHEDQITCAVARLQKWNAADPVVFMRAEGIPFRLDQYGDRFVFAPINSLFAAATTLRKVARWGKMDGQGNVRHISPFPAVCGYLTTGGPELGLGMLDQIVNVPVFAPDGTLCTDQGYHRECGSYLYTKGQEFLEVSADPTEAEVDAAWDWLMETIRDFPFSDDFSGNDPLPVRVPGEVDADGFPVPNLGRGRSSRAHWMAMFLQPFARNLIDGPTPAYLIDKSMPGTGAGYLANTLGYALTGRPMTPETPPANGEEFHKTITASLRNGPQVMFLDNINFKLDSGALAAALTSGQWRGRILGQTEMVDVPVRCTWIMAANQGSFSRELMRRVVPIRLDAAVPDPARDRKKDWYKHQDINQFLNTNRTTLVWAAHTIIQAWLVAGRPGYAGEPLQSFNEWSRVMGGILEFHGMEGFLENVTDYLNDRVDEGDDLRDYVERLVGTVGVGSEWTADDAYSAATHPLRPDAIDPALGLNLGAGPESTVRQRLYQKLSESVGKVWDVPLPGHAEARIQLTKRRTKKGNRYTLVELK